MRSSVVVAMWCIVGYSFYCDVRFIVAKWCQAKLSYQCAVKPYSVLPAYVLPSKLQLSQCSDVYSSFVK